MHFISRKVLYGSSSGDSSPYEVSEGARLHFVKFETKHIDKCLDYIAQSIGQQDRDEGGQGQAVEVRNVALAETFSY